MDRAPIVARDAFRRRQYGAASIAALLVATVTASPACAQSPAPGQAAQNQKQVPAKSRDENANPNTEEAVGAEIVVTAQKRRESIQDVPVSVTAITQRMIENFKITDFNEYATLVPGLSNTFQSSAATRGTQIVGLRGVQTINGQFISGQNTVGFYIDNSPIPVMDPHLLDIDHIEVLRGPQGTLYGSSSLGGTIKIIPNKPEFDRVSGMVNQEVSTTDYSGGIGSLTEGVINVPLGNGVAVRAVGYYEHAPGYTDFVGVRPAAGNPAGVLTGVTRKDSDRVNNYGGRISLRVKPTDRLDITASLLFNQSDSANWPLYMPALPLFTQRAYTQEPSHDKMLFADIVAQWDLGAVQLVSSTSYFKGLNDALNDQTPSFTTLFPSLPILPAQTTQNNYEWTHETRLVSQWGGPLKAVAGVFYTQRKNHFSFFLSAQGNPFLLLPIFPIPNDTLFSNDSIRNRREEAVFGELTLDVFRGFSLTAGLRAFHFDFTTRDVFVGPSLLVANQRLDQPGAAKQSGVVPRFRAEFKPSHDALFYLSAAKGFRMGGANYPLPATPDCQNSLRVFFGTPDAPQTFGSDSLWSYEAGAKTTLFHGRMTFDASAYHIDWNNTQVPVVLAVGLCPFNGQSANVGKVTSDGFELESTLQPFKGATIIANVAHIHARVAQDFRFPNALVALAHKGDQLPDIPNWTASVLAEYDVPLSATTKGFIRGDYRYTSARKAILTSQSVVKGAYSLVNLSLGVDIRNWEASVFVLNLTDSRPSYLGQPFPTTLAGFEPDQTERPRTIGAGLRLRF
jgi:outer membrane receptor protein involved in Fe transport